MSCRKENSIFFTMTATQLNSILQKDALYGSHEHMTITRSAMTGIEGTSVRPPNEPPSPV